MSDEFRIGDPVFVRLADGGFVAGRWVTADKNTVVLSGVKPVARADIVSIEPWPAGDRGEAHAPEK